MSRSQTCKAFSRIIHLIIHESRDCDNEQGSVFDGPVGPGAHFRLRALCLRVLCLQRGNSDTPPSPEIILLHILRGTTCANWSWEGGIASCAGLKPETLTYINPHFPAAHLRPGYTTETLLASPLLAVRTHLTRRWYSATWILVWKATACRMSGESMTASGFSWYVHG